ncbi:hypothetical protein R1sor_021892 [Riccia sorocarpa]|uniref:Uncharacterized protein n=1 Tax=Riccia sorocarpa TaxID=122646 RepID=A0ABD3GJT0_9MARC
MATSSGGDKGKAPMVEQEDIGTEEGELLDVRPPLLEPIGRSGGDRKRKKPAREEEETNNQTPLEKRFFTPGSLRGIQNFRSHLMELAIVKFLEEKEKPDVRP